MALKSKHRTADGTTILIAEMESDDLLNWINYAIREAEKLSPESAPYTKAFDRLYGIERNTPEVSAAVYSDAVERLVSTLEPYLAEVFIRNFNDAQNRRIGIFRARFQACVGRSSKLIDGWAQVQGVCVDCGTTDNVTFEPCPYASDVHHDDTPVWLCKPCARKRALEV